MEGEHIGVQNYMQRELKARGPILGSYWTFLVLTALQIEHNRHWPTLCGLFSPPSSSTREPRSSMGAKVPLKVYTGFKKNCHRNQTGDFGARDTVEYHSVLNQ